MNKFKEENLKTFHQYVGIVYPGVSQLVTMNNTLLAANPEIGKKAVALESAVRGLFHSVGVARMKLERTDNQGVSV